MVKDQDKDTDAARESFIFNTTNEVLNSISMFSAFLVIITILYLRIRHKALSNRVSLRLQVYISITDMFFAAFQIMMVNSDPPGNWVCRVAPWGFVFTALLGCFLTVAIAFNLKIIFVNNYICTQPFEKFYMIIPLSLSLLLSVLPVIFDALGFDEKEVSCWYKNGNTASAVIWEWSTLHGWILGSVIYCIYSVITIINRLLESNKHFLDVNKSETNAPEFSNTYQKSRKRQSMINQAVKRIVLYPIVPIITFLFNIISTLILFITQRNYFKLQMLSNIGTSSQGLLNSLVFCFDPAMRQIWYEVFKYLLKIFHMNNKKDDNDDDGIDIDIDIDIDMNNNDDNGNVDGEAGNQFGRDVNTSDNNHNLNYHDEITNSKILDEDIIVLL